MKTVIVRAVTLKVATVPIVIVLSRDRGLAVIEVGRDRPDAGRDRVHR